ncbi:helix-turn-helix domain-containing protein [Pigmentiphaga soli]|uniref:Helix-turn-helix domain-containing protein n=1 Tax=Pigmentiphaga soli TaxID=1007095 RepID=A0ABP8GZ24_9BURK
MPAKIKSALRVLQILEYFDELQCGLTAAEISDELHWPRSSTWGLLQTLSEAGFLQFDPYSKTYLPSERVSALGLWAYTPLFAEGHMLKMMHALREQTGGRVVLAAQTGNSVRYIHTVQGVKLGSTHFRRGTPVPMLDTSVGRLFLSLYTDGEATRIIHRIRATSRAAEPISISRTLEELAEIRRSGYSVSINRQGTGYGTVSMLLPRIYEQARPLGVAISCVKDIIEARQQEFAGILAAAITRYFGDLARM